MTSFFPDDVKQAAGKMSSDWIKGPEFDGTGLVLQLAKPLEKIQANNTEYGAEEDDYLVKGEILQVGQLLRFTFNTPESTERKFDTKSTPFFIGFKQCDELGVGDWVRIVRTGKTNKTRYTVTKLEPSEVTITPKAEATEAAEPKTIDYPAEDINPDDIPF